MAAAVLATLIAGVWAFDWNWFRPALQHHLSVRSGREVRIGGLDLSFGPGFAPTVHLLDVKVQNAPWADDRPFAVAQEAAFTFGWKTLLERQPVVSRLVLRHADVDLERQADGLRNWRLTRPDDRGPPRMRIQALEAHDSRLRFIHRGLDLDFNASESPAPEASKAEGFSSVIRFNGRYREARFDGETLAGPLITLQLTGQPVALRGHAKTGPTRLLVDGQVSDVLKLEGVDAELKLEGPSLTQLQPFLRGNWPATHAYRVQMHFKKNQDDYALSDLQMQVGQSKAEGELTIHNAAERPHVEGRLNAQTLAWADVRASESPEAAHQAVKADATDERRLFSDRKLQFASFANMEGQLQVQAQQLVMPVGWPRLQRLRAKAELAQGVLTVSDFSVALASGEVGGRFKLDSTQQPPRGQADVQARGLRIDQLWPTMPEASRVEGLLDAQAQVQGRGDSIAAWLGSLDGRATASLENGRIASKLDAKLALNGSKLLRAMVSGTEPIPIHCGQAHINLRQGRGETQAIVLDTEQTHVDGAALLDLKAERYELLLVPQPKKHTLLALDSAVRVQGPLNGAKVDLVKRPAQMPGVSCEVASRGLNGKLRG